MISIQKGTSVADILAQMGASDPDGDPLGIAITNATSPDGVWEYSPDGGTTWG